MFVNIILFYVNFLQWGHHVVYCFCTVLYTCEEWCNLDWWTVFSY